MSDQPEVIHQPGEATPQEVHNALTGTGLHDREWADDQWHALLTNLVASGMATWKDVAALTLGHLNPSQVGTSLASSEGFKRRYGKGNTMRIVMEWAYQQTGRCADCGSRLELQADHMKGREQFEDPLDADFIENMTLRCRRCNVVRRPSHEFGGLTYLTAEAALMWILLVVRPRTFRDYVRMCRLYGMTMADIRMMEAWAMAHWLAKANPPAFGIEDDAATFYDLLLWPDNAITRVDSGRPVPGDAKQVAAHVRGDAVLGALAVGGDGRFRWYEQPLSFMPFSTYDLGNKEPQALAISYTPPDRKARTPQKLNPLPPRGMDLRAYAIRTATQRLTAVTGTGLTRDLPTSSPNGKILPFSLGTGKVDLTCIETGQQQQPETPSLFTDIENG
jgi:hypothetical protein